MYYKKPQISQNLRNDAALSEKLPILAASLRFVASYVVKPQEFVLISFVQKLYSLATFLSLTVKAHGHSITHCQL